MLQTPSLHHQICLAPPRGQVRTKTRWASSAASKITTIHSYTTTAHARFRSTRTCARPAAGAAHDPDHHQAAVAAVGLVLPELKEQSFAWFLRCVCRLRMHVHGPIWCSCRDANTTAEENQRRAERPAADGAMKRVVLDYTDEHANFVSFDLPLLLSPSTLPAPVSTRSTGPNPRDGSGQACPRRQLRYMTHRTRGLFSQTR